jgi:hypothetical protein
MPKEEVRMPSSERFAVDPTRVVHETIDGESIVIHLETGAYYSLRDTAAEIFVMLDHGWSGEEVVDELARRYDAPPESLHGSVQEFMEALLREELVERRNGGPHPERKPVPATPTGEFSAPELQKYTDMQYFLLLDPIHEVAASGWPNAGSSGSD